MRQDGWLYAAVSGFIGGVALHSFFDVGIWFSVFTAGLGALLFLVLFLLPRRTAAAMFSALLVLSFGLGSLRYDSVNPFRPPELEANISQFVQLTGVVSEEPDRRENSTLFTVSVGSSVLKGIETATEAKVLVNAERYRDLAYGDRIWLRGTLERPKNFETDNGRTFNYGKYLEKEGIAYTMFRPRIELIERGQGNFIKAKLFSLKHLLLATLSKVIPAPESALLGGLLLGGRDALSSDLQDIFRTAGIIHIVVLSGYNITIVAEFIMRLFGFMSFQLRLASGATAIVLFAIMTGGSATAIRASAMALLVLLARAIGRKYDISRALLIAGMLMVVENPRILVFDLSFELSFSATVGLIYVAPIIERYLIKVPTRFKVREVTVATLATQITVLPLLLYTNGLLSLVALPVNLLILPLIPLTMFLGFFTGVVGLVSTALTLPLAYLSYALLHYEIAIPTFFANLPYASVAVTYFPAWLMLITYALLASALFFYYQKLKSTYPTDSLSAVPQPQSN